MKNKVILVSFIALFAMIFALSAVAAFANIDEVEVNDIYIHSGETSVGHVLDTVPVEVEFTANKDVDERVNVKSHYCNLQYKL